MAICRAADSGLASPEPIQLSHFACRAGSGAVCARIGELSHCTSFDNRERVVFVTMRQTTRSLRICAHSKLQLEFGCYGPLMGRLLAFVLRPGPGCAAAFSLCVPLQQPLIQAGPHGRSVSGCRPGGHGHSGNVAGCGPLQPWPRLLAGGTATAVAVCRSKSISQVPRSRVLGEQYSSESNSRCCSAAAQARRCSWWRWGSSRGTWRCTSSTAPRPRCGAGRCQALRLGRRHMNFCVFEYVG